MSYLINFVRIPALALRQHVRPLPRMSVLEEDAIAMRVWPNDIDLNLHMNNGRYLSVMDYARTHLLARTRLLDHIIRGRWQPLVGAVWMTYRRSMPLFAKFTVTSRLVCWDERWFYIEQIFMMQGSLVAVGWVKGLLRDRRGNLDPQNVIDRVAKGTASPPMTEAMATWNELTREKLQAERG